MRFGWFTRLRLVLGALATFAFGVLAATSGVWWPILVIAAAAFLVGCGLVLDALVMARSWRMTQAALKVPSLLSRNREIVGRDDLSIERADRAVLVRGSHGVGRVTVNPLVARSDLHRWFDGLPDD